MWIVTPLSSTSVRTPVENYSAVIPVILWMAARSEDGLSALVGALSGVPQPRDRRQGDRPRRRVIERAGGRASRRRRLRTGVTRSAQSCRCRPPCTGARAGACGSARSLGLGSLNPRGAAASAGCIARLTPVAARRSATQRGEKRGKNDGAAPPEHPRNAETSPGCRRTRRERRSRLADRPVATRTPCAGAHAPATTLRRPRSGDHALRGTIDDRHADGAGPLVAVSGVPPVRPPCTSGTPRRAGRPRLPPWRAHSRGSAGPWVRRRRPRRGWLR